MTTYFPAALDTFVNPSPSDLMTSPTVPHDQQHANLNDAVSQIESFLVGPLSSNPRISVLYLNPPATSGFIGIGVAPRAGTGIHSKFAFSDSTGVANDLFTESTITAAADAINLHGLRLGTTFDANGHNLGGSFPLAVEPVFTGGHTTANQQSALYVAPTFDVDIAGNEITGYAFKSTKGFHHFEASVTAPFSAGMTWDAFAIGTFNAIQLTVIGAGTVTNELGAIHWVRPQITTTLSAAVNVEKASTFLLDGAPQGIGTVSIHYAYTLHVAQGITQLDGALNVTSTATMNTIHMTSGSLTLDTGNINLTAGGFSEYSVLGNQFIIGYDTSNRLLVNIPSTGAQTWAISGSAPSISLQGGALAVNASGAPATSAALDVQGTTGALLVPRLTTTQKAALTPTNGMIVYDTTLGKFQGYEAGAWAAFSTL